MLRATNHRQEPFVYGSLGGDTVALVPATAEAPSAPAAALQPRPPPRRPARRSPRAECGYERGLGLSDGRASRLARRLARLPRRSSKRLLRPAGPGGDRQAPRQSESGGVEERRSAPLSADELCKRDEDRLVRLRANPASDEAERFATELSCEQLRPQLSRLMESLGFALPAPQAHANPPPVTEATAVEPASDCGSEQEALDRLRAQPSADAAQAFWRGLQCERLRPQARLLMYSLDLTPDEPRSHPVLGDASAALPPKGNDVRGVAAPGDSPAADPAACEREKEELARLRANPDRRDAERFARAMTCESLKPQAARLLESLTD